MLNNHSNLEAGDEFVVGSPVDVHSAEYGRAPTWLGGTIFFFDAVSFACNGDLVLR